MDTELVIAPNLKSVTTDGRLILIMAFLSKIIHPRESHLKKAFNTRSSRKANFQIV